MHNEITITAINSRKNSQRKFPNSITQFQWQKTPHLNSVQMEESAALPEATKTEAKIRC